MVAGWLFVAGIVAVYRDGVEDLVRHHSVGETVGLQGLQLSLPLDREKDGSVALVYGLLLLEGSQCEDVVSRTPMSYATSVVNCAEQVYRSHPTTSFFEYFNASGDCYALLTRDGVHPSFCKTFSFNVTGNTYSVVVPGTPFLVDDEAVTMDCVRCRYSSDSFVLPRGDHDASAGIGGTALGDFGLDTSSVQREIHDDGAVRLSEVFLQVSFTLRHSITTTNGSSAFGEGFFTGDAPYAVLFSRGPLTAVVFKTGAVEFAARKSRADAENPVVDAYGISLLSDSLYCSPTVMDPLLTGSGRSSFPLPVQQFEFARHGDSLMVSLKGRGADVTCIRRMSNNYKLVGPAPTAADELGSVTGRTVDTHLSWAHVPTAWQALSEDEDMVMSYMCRHDLAIATFLDGTMAPPPSHKTTADDCGARCATTAGCKYFSYASYEQVPSGLGPQCTVYESCHYLNDTSAGEVFNSTLYEMRRHEEGQPWHSVSTRDGKTCLTTVSGETGNIPDFNQLLQGVDCTKEDDEGYALPAWNYMFLLDLKSNVLKLRHHGRPAALTAEAASSDADKCVTTEGDSVQLNAVLVVKACSSSTVSFFYDLVSSQLRVGSASSQVCLELTKDVHASTGSCDRGAQNQTIIVEEKKSVDKRYQWRSSTGLLQWTINGGNPKHGYAASEHGLSSYPAKDRAVHPKIIVKSPIFCNPTYISFDLTGGSGVGRHPRAKGFLGVVLTDVSTRQAVAYKTFDHAYQTPQIVKWTGIEAQFGPSCYVLELVDDTTHYLTLQNVLITTQSAPAVCLDITSIRVRSSKPGTTLHIAEIEVFDSQNVNIAPTHGTLSSSSFVNESTLSFLVDEDTNVHSHYHETSARGILEWIQIDLSDGFKTRFTLSAVTIFPSTASQVTGCSSAESCLKDADALMVEIIGEGGVVLRQYPLLDASETGNITVPLCPAGYANESAALRNAYACSDGLKYTTGLCTISSDASSTHSPYLLKDLGSRQAVSSVTLYLPAAHNLDDMASFRDHSNDLSTSVFQIWVGDDASGPYAAEGGTRRYSNRLCLNSTNTNSSLEANGEVETHFLEAQCGIMGRFVYVVAPGKHSLILNEVEVYALASALTPVNSADLQVDAFASHPTVTRRISSNGADWSQIACSLDPVHSFSITLPAHIPAVTDYCYRDSRLALSISSRPSKTNVTSYLNETSMHPSDGDELFFSWSTRSGKLFVKGRDITEILFDSGTEGASWCGTGDYHTATYQLARGPIRGDIIASFTLADASGKAQYNTSATLPVRILEPLFGCLLPYDQNQVIKYNTVPCDLHSVTQEQTFCPVRPADATIPFKFGRWSTYPAVVSTANATSRDSQDKFVESTTRLQNVDVTRLSLKTARVPHRKYPAATWARKGIQPVAGNVTRLASCHDDYMITIPRTEGGVGRHPQRLLLEFNATQSGWVKVFLRQRALTGQPWMLHEGWSFAKVEALRSNSFDEFASTKALALRHVQSGELVEIHGFGNSMGDHFVESPIVCFSKGDTADVPHEKQQFLALFEGFDSHLGACSSTQIVNPEEEQRSASSSLFDDIPGYGFHRGRLDSLVGWRAKYNVQGEWYQLSVTPATEPRHTNPTLSLVAGVVLQGLERREIPESEWTTLFSVNYSTDGELWYPVDAGRSWSGNNHYKSKVERHFFRPVWAKYIRVVPIEWHRAVAMRAGVILCGGTQSSHVGFRQNATNKEMCVVSLDDLEKVEGSGSLRMDVSHLEHYSDGINEDPRICLRTEVRLDDITEHFGYINPSRLSLWGQVSSAKPLNAWQLTVNDELSFAVGGNNALRVNDDVVGGVEDNTWFCIVLNFVKEVTPRIPGSAIIAVRWEISSTAPFSPTFTDSSSQHILTPSPGHAFGEVLVRWDNLDSVALLKGSPVVTAWFDALQVHSDVGSGPARYSFNSRLLLKRPSELSVQASSEETLCQSYLGYNTSSPQDDYPVHRLTGLERPFLKHENCMMQCCALSWCSGVALRLPNSREVELPVYLSAEGVSNGTNMLGCRLLRRLFIDTDIEKVVTHPAAVLHIYMLKVAKATAVITAGFATRNNRKREVPAHDMRSLPYSAQYPRNIDDVEDFYPWGIGGAGTSVRQQISRDGPGIAFAYVLHFEGAFLNFSEADITHSVTSSRSVEDEPFGFEALKQQILPPGAAVDLSLYPPFVRVNFWRAETYHLESDEVLSFTTMNPSLRLLSNNSEVINNKGGPSTGGSIVGLRQLPTITLRSTHPCNGQHACRGRPCACASVECLQAYICSCSSTFPSNPEAPLGFSLLSKGDSVAVINDKHFVKWIQTRFTGPWKTRYDAVIGLEGVVISVSKQEDRSVDTTAGQLVQVAFGVNETIETFHSLALLKTEGLEICKFHRRPRDWPFELVR
ncbi:hypothetical protein DIPPA_55310 [Diplonema papillatum]|nr:hypothetical protein DIPPA_55310 [Diplonema papillatum]